MKFTASFFGAVLLFVANTTASFGYVVGPTTPGKWGSPLLGTGATITWSLMGGGLTTDDGLSSDFSTFMPPGYEDQIAAAFAAWSAVADITFIQVADCGLAFNAGGCGGDDIRLGGHAFDGPGGTLAHGYYPPANGTTAAGDIHFDVAETWKIGFGGPGFDIFQVTAHEIGHAIGLDHTPEMTSLMYGFYTEDFTGLQPDDIAGAQYLYGRASVVPLPAAFPLFASALLVMSVLGWRIHRKALA